MTSGMSLETLRAVIAGAFPELSNSKLTLLTAGLSAIAADLLPLMLHEEYPKYAAAPAVIPGVAIGVLFLGETLTATAWIGLLCVMAGVAAMTLPGRRATATMSHTR